MIDRQEARSDVARIDPAADRWLHTANRARATTDPRVGRLVKAILPVRLFQLGCSNYHNLHIWAEENPRELFPRGFQHRFSVNLWTGLLGDRLASIRVVDPSIC
jgi:hypothetical protein